MWFHSTSLSLSLNSSQASEVKLLSRVRPFVTPWTAACQAPLSMGFSRQQYWNGLPIPSPGIFPTQGSNPGLPQCRQMLLPSEPPGKSKKKNYTFSNFKLFMLLFLIELSSRHLIKYHTLLMPLLYYRYVSHMTRIAII